MHDVVQRVELEEHEILAAQRCEPKAGGHGEPDRAN
jgi:hypothetical protein